MSRLLPLEEQFHQLYTVAGFHGEITRIEAGIGFGLTKESDRLNLKLILSRDFP